MTYSDLPSFWETVRQAMLLNESIFSVIWTVPGGIWTAWLVVLLAGLSEAVGQSVVLFINRVRPSRFGLTLFAAAFSHVVGYAFWSVTIWGIGNYVFERPQSLYAVAAFVGLAYAPRLFSFFILTPLFGVTISWLLSFWSLYVTIVAIGVGFELPLWQAAATSGLGWLCIQIWFRTLGRPLAHLGRWIEDRIAGVPLRLTVDDASRLRRPAPQVWQGWKEQLEQRVVQLSDGSIAGSPLASSLPGASNGNGKAQ